MLKMYRFSTSIFSGFGLDLAGSWASKMEPRWQFWPPDLKDVNSKSLLKLDVLKEWRLGGLLARFWRPQDSILEGLGWIFSRFSHDFGHACRELAENLPRTCRELAKNLPRPSAASGALPSIAQLQWPSTSRQKLPRGLGAAVVRPQRVFIK